MATFSRFTDLPKELQLLIWEAAIPQSPSVHFLSYPSKDRYKAGTHQWQRELVNAKRTISVDNAGYAGTRARSRGRYSSYFASLALLHACQESRRVCLAHTASSNARQSDKPKIVSTVHYNLNLATDIICIQDLDPRFPWNVARCLSLSPRLDPVRIALERRLYVYCSRPPFVDDWVTALSGGLDGESSFSTSLGREDGERSLKVIYLLDYDIKPKHEIAGTTSDGAKPQSESATEPASSGLKLTDHDFTSNGKFHGHGVTFYALSSNKKAPCTGWVIPQEAHDFCSSVYGHIYHRYGYEIVDSVEEAMGGDFKICVEFLACVKA